MNFHCFLWSPCADWLRFEITLTWTQVHKKEEQAEHH